MSGKYNKKHPDRSTSRYPQRLAARGLGKAPAMVAVEVLRTRQIRRTEQTGSPFPASREEGLLRDIFSESPEEEAA
jgi:hypothetical protein